MDTAVPAGQAATSMQVLDQRLLDECRELFRALVKTDTTNPPGRERAAADHIARALKRRGIKFEILEVERGRANIIARIPGGPKPPLTLLSHLDVVGADAKLWTRPPFSADEYEGDIWGRGTIDTKQLTAMELAGFLSLAESGIKPDRDLIFAATADEETGSRLGMEFLAKTALKLNPGALAINEGGGFPIEFAGRWFVICTAGEKGMCRARVASSGAGIGAFAEGLSRILGHRSAPDIRGIPLLFLRSLGLDPETLVQSAETGTLEDPKTEDNTGGLLNYMLYDSVMVNRIGPRDSASLIPHEHEAELEFRVSPAVTESKMRTLLEELLGNLPLTCTIEAFEPGFECDPSSPLFGILASNCRRFGLDAEMLPILALGRTDGRFLGWHGASVFGFSPVLLRDEFRSVLTRVHGIDERIGVDSFDFGCKVLAASIMEICTSMEE